MIPPQIVAVFPTSVRVRGDQYVSENRIALGAADPHIVRAIVRGTSSYIVKLKATSGEISASCDCAYADEHGICKHIWATLRVADREKRLEKLTATAGRKARFIALGNDEEFDGQSDVDDLGIGDADDDAHISLLNDEWDVPSSRATRDPIFGDDRRFPRETHSKQRQPLWKTLLDDVNIQMATPTAGGSGPREWPADIRIVYIVDLSARSMSSGLPLELATERLKRDGTWDRPVQFQLPTDVWRTIPDQNERRIAQFLIGATPNPYAGHMRPGVFTLTGPAIDIALPLICETGRCRVRRLHGERPLDAVAFDAGEPWKLHVRVIRDTPHTHAVDAALRRGAQEMSLNEPEVLHESGVLLVHNRFARFDAAGAFALVQLFRERKRLVVHDRELPHFLESLYMLPKRPPIELPADAQVTESHAPPRFGLIIHSDPSSWRGTHRRLEPFFAYGRSRISGAKREPSFFERQTLTIHHRDLAAEQSARERLAAAGAKDEWHYGGGGKSLVVNDRKVMRLIRDLVAEGWYVEADGHRYREAGDVRASVRSGVDWFDLSARVKFDDFEIALPELIAASRAGADTITLADGSQALVPTDLVARFGPLLAGASSGKNGVLRFTTSQTALLDALLDVLPEHDVDATFETARSELRSFEHVTPVDPPPSFHGTLREYQREGLGWLHFLRAFRLGGCLADDMGLGKTIQVLALLESRRIEQSAGGSGSRRPSIVVVPRSLVFNWTREAERFTPELRVLDYTGTGRRLDDATLAATDVVLTTYGTLRRDAAALADIEFDYAILDEAQAIKTGSSASAKAARLLRASHRLAMTGTPIENRLEELWSLFEFLNPGMLGASTAFAALVRVARESPDGMSADRGVLARALRPVILRRTKDQVAPDLPPRVEQSLYVELEGPQRKFYDSVLTAYRESVFDRVERLGLSKARMHILEALLRLRQAACHPALVDETKTAAPSAKLDALVPALDEVIAEGHKALVFSQFTSFLALLRERLDADGVVYEYLDGSVRDRQSRVDRFQTDPACPLFLISLKAGGSGLNLTAAEYVFVLDPWWNPAVEAQAIDRAHRIGQGKRVIATRIIARDTIEEKILELQASKRALADAILGQDDGVLARIGRDELAMLLS